MKTFTELLLALGMAVPVDDAQGGKRLVAKDALVPHPPVSHDALLPNILLLVDPVEKRHHRVL